MKKLLLIVSVLFFSIACEKQKGNVKYNVHCTPAGFEVTYRNSTGDYLTGTVEDTIWTSSFQGASKQTVFVEATALNDSVVVTCEISYDGQVLETATDSGHFITVPVAAGIP